MVAQNTLRANCMGNQVFFLNKFQLEATVNVNNCLKHIKLSNLFHARAPHSKSSFNMILYYIRTMLWMIILSFRYLKHRVKMH